MYSAPVPVFAVPALPARATAAVAAVAGGDDARLRPLKIDALPRELKGNRKMSALDVSRNLRAFADKPLSDPQFSKMTEDELRTLNIDRCVICNGARGCAVFAVLPCGDLCLCETDLIARYQSRAAMGTSFTSRPSNTKILWTSSGAAAPTCPKCGRPFTGYTRVNEPHPPYTFH
jgi:hypothetical protein